MLGGLWCDEAGLTAMEYALLLVLVALSAIVSWQGLAGATAASVEQSASHLPGAG